MTSTTVDGVVFWVKRSCELVWFAAAAWTLVPLYNRNAAEFRARCWLWIFAPIPWAINYSYELANTALERLAVILLEFGAVQRIVEASGIPRGYYEHVLPSAVTLVVTIYLCIRYVLWGRRLGEQKSDQIEAQCQDWAELKPDEQRFSSGALSKD